MVAGSHRLCAKLRNRRSEGLEHAAKPNFISHSIFLLLWACSVADQQLGFHFFCACQGSSAWFICRNIILDCAIACTVSSCACISKVDTIGSYICAPAMSFLQPHYSGTPLLSVLMMHSLCKEKFSATRAWRGFVALVSMVLGAVMREFYVDDTRFVYIPYCTCAYWELVQQWMVSQSSPLPKQILYFVNVTTFHFPRYCVFRTVPGKNVTTGF